MALAPTQVGPSVVPGLVIPGKRQCPGPRELEDLIDLVEKRGLIVDAVAAGKVDLSNTDGQFMARQLVSSARKSSDDASRRIKRTFVQKRERGEWLGGYRLFGFHPVGDPPRFEVDAAEAKQIRRAATDVLNGVGLGTVARRWNEAGSTSTRGRPWDTTNLRRLLSNPALVPDILVAEDHQQMVELFDGRKAPRAPAEYKLTGGVGVKNSDHSCDLRLRPSWPPVRSV